MQFQGFDWLSGHGTYEPLYHAREIATIQLSFGCSCKRNKQDRGIFPYLFFIVFNACWI